MGYLPHLEVGYENWLIFIIHAILISQRNLTNSILVLGVSVWQNLYSGKCTAKSHKNYSTILGNDSPKLTSNTFTNDIESIPEVNFPWNISERFRLKRIP